MKTILFTYRIPFHPERGGIERVGDLLARSFIKRGYRVIYLCQSFPDSYKGYNYPAEIYQLTEKNTKDNSDNCLYKKIISDKNVQVIFNHSYLGDSRLFISHQFLKNIKVISVIHSKPTTDYDNIYKRRNDSIIEYLRRIIRVPIWHFKGVKNNLWNAISDHYTFIYNNSDKVCLLSNKFRPVFSELIADMSDEKVKSIPNPNTYSKCEYKLHKQKQILFVGRFDMNVKRPDRLLKIWKQLYTQYPEWELIFLGDGDCRQELERMAKKLDRVKFIGFQDPKPYYEQASIICMTSNYEGWGMVLTEAMVHGVVPLAFNSFESVTDIIEDEKNGLLVKPFSLNEYAKKLSALMSDNERREEMGRYAQKSVEKYDIEKITDRWEELFINL